MYTVAPARVKWGITMGEIGRDGFSRLPAVVGAADGLDPGRLPRRWGGVTRTLLGSGKKKCFGVKAEFLVLRVPSGPWLCQKKACFQQAPLNHWLVLGEVGRDEVLCAQPLSPGDLSPTLMAGLGLDPLVAHGPVRTGCRLCCGITALQGSSSRVCAFSLDLREIESVIWISILTTWLRGGGDGPCPPPTWLLWL